MLKVMRLAALGVLLWQAGAGTSTADELSDTGQFLDGVAAIVNEGVVLKSQLYEQIETIEQQAKVQGIPLPPDDVLEEQVLERLIVDEIQLQRAARIGLRIADQDVNDAIARIAAQQTPPVRFEDMPTLLASQGVSYAQFREDIREELMLESLRRIDVGQRINVSPREIEQCIADLEDNVVVNSEYNLSHILVSIPEAATADDIAAATEKVDSIYRQIQEGADFREMAVRYSEGPTALEGGGLGWIAGEQVPSLFIDVIAPLGAGDVSEPFRSASSFHLVKVNDLRSAVQKSEVNQVKARHILVTPNEIIDDETAKQRLEDALERIRGGEEFGEVAQLLSDDPGSASQGGDLGWTGPGAFVPEFEQTLASLEIGEISEPFKSPFGWHIVEVLDRRVYDNTEDLKRRNCDMRIRNSKMEEETQLWVRRLRDEAYVDKRIGS